MENYCEDDVISYDEYGKSIYCRQYSNSSEQLSFELSKKYNCKNCILATSGMAAITGCLSGIIDWKSKDCQPYNFIYGNELYSDDQNVFDILASRHSLTKNTIDVRYPDTIINTFSSLNNGRNILFIESCTNPNGHLFDFSIIPTLRSLSQSLVVVVDNTWLTSEVFNPFEYGADFVVLSLSKYYSAGQVICGAIMQSKNYENDETIYSIYDWYEFIGQHVSPARCRVILNALNTMEERISRSYNLTKKIVNTLISRGIIVSYPKVKTFKKYGPSILTFSIVRSLDFKPRKPVKAFSFIKYETSYGSKKSRICPWSIVIEPNIGHGTMTITYRLALGYEDTYDNVMSDLNTLLTF